MPPEFILISFIVASSLLLIFRKTILKLTLSAAEPIYPPFEKFLRKLLKGLSFFGPIIFILVTGITLFFYLKKKFGLNLIVVLYLIYFYVLVHFVRTVDKKTKNQ